MEPEGNSIMNQRVLAVFCLVEIVLRCALTMNEFQGLMMQSKGSDNGAGSLEAPSSNPESQSWSKYISEKFQQAQIRLDILFRYDMLIPVPTVGLHHKILKANYGQSALKNFY
ncbi:hypothetical protein EVAR_61083_1 [Eumeta japonica]|uniref:Uncharacterized protein n=1 Tax=Eumeta variegata TaxID=151549 RepID=A0A4C1YKY6_EUMVA|nr:hypothetical protein EVAR_61083_1 [Eumeta japonica]